MNKKPKPLRGISSNYESAQLQVRMATDAPLAVIVAKYNNSKSRMLLWETDRDVFHPGQWLKGGIRLLDVSADGQYVAYHVMAPSRPVDYYIAISKPPFLTALFFRPVTMPGGGTGYFHPQGGFFWAGSPTEGSWVPGHPEYGYSRTEPGCPFEIAQMDDYKAVDQLLREKEALHPGVLAAVERYGPAAREMLTEPWKGAKIHPSVDERLLGRPKMRFPCGKPWRTTWDHQVRLIVADSPRLLVFREGVLEPEELLDLSQTVWSFMPPPEWAKRW